MFVCMLGSIAEVCGRSFFAFTMNMVLNLKFLYVRCMIFAARHSMDRNQRGFVKCVVCFVSFSLTFPFLLLSFSFLPIFLFSSSFYQSIWLVSLARVMRGEEKTTEAFASLAGAAAQPWFGSISLASSLHLSFLLWLLLYWPCFTSQHLARESDDERRKSRDTEAFCISLGRAAHPWFGLISLFSSLHPSFLLWLLLY